MNYMFHIIKTENSHSYLSYDRMEGEYQLFLKIVLLI